MYVFFKNDIITELISVMELMAESLRNIIYYENEYDLDSYSKEMEIFNMYLSKEQLLLNRIPRNAEVLDYILNFVSDTSNFEIKDKNNYKYVIARFISSINDIIRSLSNDDYLDQQQIYNMISNNLTCEYLNSINSVYMVSDDLDDNYTFRNIQYYNVFVNRPVFEVFYKNGFSFDNLSVYTDNELSNYLKMDMEDFLEYKEEVIASSISSYIDILFGSSSKKDSLVTLDFYLNFKFLLSKLSDENLLSLKEDIISYYDEIDIEKLELGRDVLDAIDREIDKRNILSFEKKYEVNLSLNDFNILTSLFKLESIIYDKFYNDDFQSLNNLLQLEKDYLAKIDSSSMSISLLDNMLNNELWLYIEDNDERKIDLIKQRLFTLLPFFKDLNAPSSQTNESFLSIYKNFLVKNLSVFYNLIQSTDNDIVKNVFNSIYKDNFFVNSELTDEYVSLNGNYGFIIPLSDDTLEMESNLSSLEYNYDKIRMMYSYATGSFDYLVENENNIESIYDFANYQFQIISFLNSANELDYVSIQELKSYIKKNSPRFSKMRRDLIKIIDLNDNSSGKTISIKN